MTLALISDIHANLAALEAVLADAKAAGVTRFLCMGDIIGYNGEPDECLSLVRAHTDVTILGNHDSYITTGQNCERSQVVAGIIDRHRAEISDENLAWLKGAVPSVQEGDTLWVHGGPNDTVDEYLYEVSEATFPPGVRRLFAGHTHVQVIHRFGDKVFCNPGSVGQPRDGDPRAAYAILHGDEIELRRVAYDVDRTIAVMQAKGYEPYTYRGLPIGAQINGKVSAITQG